MLTDPIDADAVTPGELVARYEDGIARVVDSVGADVAADETGIAPGRVDPPDGEDLTVEEAAALIALGDGRDREAVLAEVRDHIMLSMSTAVLDVDAVAVGLEGELSAREIQAKIEGRLPMSVAEYAHVHHYIASQQ